MSTFEEMHVLPDKLPKLKFRFDFKKITLALVTSSGIMLVRQDDNISYIIITLSYKGFSRDHLNYQPLAYPGLGMTNY